MMKREEKERDGLNMGWGEVKKKLVALDLNQSYQAKDKEANPKELLMAKARTI